MPSSAVDLTVLTNSEVFRSFSRIMATLNGLPVALYASDGTHLRAYDTEAQNPLCVLVRAHPDGVAGCRASECARFAEVVASHRQVCRLCHAGLLDLAVPVSYHGTVVAVLSSGQLLPAPHSPEGLQAFLPLCARFNIDPTALRKGYARCRYLTPDKLQATIELLSFFAEYLSTMVRQLAGGTHDDAEALMLRARWYIQSHLAEDLSLGQVAAYIERSPGYLSRQFERVVGMNFLTYVQQARVEHVQHLITHSTFSITEIALMAGFNSLSQFNRTFRRHTGSTPRTFRARQRGKRLPDQ